jgi:hypothetical protein
MLWRRLLLAGLIPYVGWLILCVAVAAVDVLPRPTRTVAETGWPPGAAG